MTLWRFRQQKRVCEVGHWTVAATLTLARPNRHSDRGPFLRVLHGGRPHTLWAGRHVCRSL